MSVGWMVTNEAGREGLHCAKRQGTFSPLKFDRSEIGEMEDLGFEAHAIKP